MDLGIEIKTKLNDDGTISLETEFVSGTKKVERDLKGKSKIDITQDYIIIDIETTGLDPTFDEIIEISALKVKNGNIIDSFDKLVKPKKIICMNDDDESDDFVINNGEKIQYIDDFISSLTGITNQMLDKAQEIEVILPEFEKFIGNEILIGHNVNFDINFLYDNFMTYLSKPLINDFIDTLRISRKLLPNLKHHRLDDLLNYFNLEKRVEHRALNDCKLTNEIYILLSKIVNEKYNNVNEFIDLFKKHHKSHKIDVKSIVAQTTDFDESNPFYQKVCVFTGTLEKMLRKEAMQLVVNLGGICGDKVTSQTNFLILGNNDYNPILKGKKSSKQIKAETMKLRGKDIEILSENVFYDIVNEFFNENV